MFGAGITGEIEKDAGGVFFCAVIFGADILTGRGITGGARNSGGRWNQKRAGAILEASNFGSWKKLWKKLWNCGKIATKKY